MKAEQFIKRIEDLNLVESSNLRLKKVWDDHAHYYNISGANITDGDLVFHASPYGSLNMKKLIEDAKKEELSGIVRVGSFKVHYITPSFKGGTLVIKNNPKKRRNLFSFLFM